VALPGSAARDADHDLSANIAHLVLCRLSDEPPGTKALSPALLPKFLPDGARNRFRCEGLRHRMGIHGGATCVVRYEDATGWLVGEPNRGLAAVFVMMNAARLHVGLQGLGHLEMAAQNARAQRAGASGGDAPWLAERQSLALHGVQWLLPQAGVHWQRVNAGAPLGAANG